MVTVYDLLTTSLGSKVDYNMQTVHFTRLHSQHASYPHLLRHSTRLPSSSVELGLELTLLSISMNTSTRDIHLRYLQQCIELARQSPPKPTNFRVGCVIVTLGESVISTGYTLEFEGNTHAEQCALWKLTGKYAITESELFTVLPANRNAILYTSLEPCSLRLSGNRACVNRIIDTRNPELPGSGIRKIIFGAKEPGTFVKDSKSCRILTEAGVEWEYLPDFEEEILAVAMEGHDKKEQGDDAGRIKPKGGVNKILGVIQSAEQAKQDRAKMQEEGQEDSTSKATTGDGTQLEESSAPRNPKKRMMEL